MHAHQHQDTSRSAGRRRVGLVLILTSVTMVAELIGGWITGSLALLADAGHMASDVGALALSFFALWMAGRPASKHRTYGHTRAEILAALAQGAVLVGVAMMIALEALDRLGAPPHVHGPGMLGVATLGLVVNVIALATLSGHRAHNMSIRGAWLHVASDTLGSVGAIAAGAAIWAFDWRWADPAASLAIAVLVALSAWHLLRDAADVLMETAPRDLDLDALRATLTRMGDVRDVHDLHVWTIGSGEVALSCHVVAAAGGDPGELLRRVHERLAEDFSIDHATVQVEPAGFAESGDAPGSAQDGDGCATGCEPAQVAAGRP